MSSTPRRPPPLWPMVLANNPRHYGANVALGRLAIASGVGRPQGERALRLCLTLQPSENDVSQEQVAADLRELVEQSPRLDGSELTRRTGNQSISGITISGAIGSRR